VANCHRLAIARRLLARSILRDRAFADREAREERWKDAAELYDALGTDDYDIRELIRKGLRQRNASSSTSATSMGQRVREADQASLAGVDVPER
jgi:hypothetical protein